MNFTFLATPGLVLAARVVLIILGILVLGGWLITRNPGSAGVKENKGHETS